MSNFRDKAIHPKTKKVEDANFIDNHFGRHKYGVLFPSDGSIWPDEKVERVKEPSQNQDQTDTLAAKP